MTSTPEDKKPKAVALLSGGLDSNLAVRMMLEQGVEVEAVAIKTPFCDFDCGKGCGHRVKEVADELGVKLKTVYLGKEYLQMLRNPKYGYGSGMNPCIDCRAMMFRAAKDHLEQIGADFIVTGEVLQQRPMSQNKNALSIIEKETGMQGLVLRPLSARKMAQTIPEKTGLVTRESLGDISGRSRKGQLALAKRFGISDPPNAAGGCLLTDPAFSKRVKDLLDHSNDIPEINDIELLKVGRHFRLSANSKLVVGRDEEENGAIRSLAQPKDFVFEPKQFVGPTSVLRSGTANNELITKCCMIVARYSDGPKDSPSVVTVGSDEGCFEVLASPIHEQELEGMRI